ncbi:hypothetical protein CRM89_10845 [Nocardia sp. FDAARGOS_372]|nr:hypothetical protein CRM89_10845 [Nocardia sp. FDAARGOS_372]
MVGAMSGNRESRRRGRSRLGQDLTLLVIGLATLGVLTLVWAAWATGAAVAGQPIEWHPLAALFELAFGVRPWPWQAWPPLVVLSTAAAIAITQSVRRRHGRNTEIDAAARTMQHPTALSIARLEHNASAAAHLLHDAPDTIRSMPGPPLGETLLGAIPLHVPAELGVFIAAGTRTGKTMAWAIPAVLAGWGPVLATSNKPDLYRHTLTGRRHRGTVWLSDPQAVTGAVAVNWWVNLLRPVRSMATARKLASFFVDASRDADSRVDSYFDGGAQELLACHLLAAATARGDLLHVTEWLGRDQDQTPALILRAGGHHRAAHRILETQTLYARQRDGLYDMARRFLNVLSDATYAGMITPPQRRTITAYDDGTQITITAHTQPATHHLPEFIPDHFVTSTDTLYALSMSGPDSAAPLTAALVGQILEAALAAARSRPDGRLAVPLLGVLDEAANCCPIGALPNYYTYAGGHGIILMTVLQVLEQGETLWGSHGLKAIRAQSIEVYGGGIGDTDFLQQWSTLTGDHDVADYSTSTSSTGISRTRTWRTEPILSIADLAALPKTRALVRLPGHKPVLVRKIWWHDTEFRDVVEQSLAQFADADDGDDQPQITVAAPQEPQ